MWDARALSQGSTRPQRSADMPPALPLRIVEEVDLNSPGSYNQMQPTQNLKFKKTR